MEIQGVIKKISEVQTGTRQDGQEWKKVSFILEYDSSEYPKQMVFDTFDTNVIDTIAIGQSVHVEYDYGKAREYNGRFYESKRIWHNGLKILSVGADQQAPQHPKTPNDLWAQAAKQKQPKPADPNDDLPF